MASWDKDEHGRYRFGDLGGAPPMAVPFQGGTIILRGYGCHGCGGGFWTEDDEKRRLPAGELRPCPHCGLLSEVPAR